MKICKTILNIIKSRFRTDYSSWVLRRRKVCFSCPHNSKNTNKSTIKLKVYKVFSNLFSFITMSKSEDLGECTICLCDVYWKSLITKEEGEDCPLKKWE